MQPSRLAATERIDGDKQRPLSQTQNSLEGARAGQFNLLELAETSDTRRPVRRNSSGTIANWIAR